MASNEHKTAVLLDKLVMEAQQLGDLYVRCIDENPGASVAWPSQAKQLDEMFKALAGFILASNRALDAIGRYFSGEYDPAYAADPEDQDF